MRLHGFLQNMIIEILKNRFWSLLFLCYVCPTIWPFCRLDYSTIWSFDSIIWLFDSSIRLFYRSLFVYSNIRFDYSTNRQLDFSTNRVLDFSTNRLCEYLIFGFFNYLIIWFWLFDYFTILYNVPTNRLLSK